jgi:hypothetical protein
MKEIIMNACAVTRHYKIDNYQQKLVLLDMPILNELRLKITYQLNLQLNQK